MLEIYIANQIRRNVEMVSVQFQRNGRYLFVDFDRLNIKKKAKKKKKTPAALSFTNHNITIELAINKLTNIKSDIFSWK